MIPEDKDPTITMTPEEEAAYEQELYETQVEEELAKEAERSYYQQMMFDDWLREQQSIDTETEAI